MIGVVGQAFKNLRRRFKTIRGHLSDELRGAAHEVMARDGGAPTLSVQRRNVGAADEVPCQALADASTESRDTSTDHAP